MKDQTVTSMLEAGEIQMTDDVLYMVATVIDLFQRGLESDNGGQFIGYALALLETWRETLEAGDGETQMADAVIEKIVAGGRI